MKKTKRLLSLFLAALMVLTAFPVTGMLAYADTTQNISKTSFSAHANRNGGNRQKSNGVALTSDNNDTNLAANARTTYSYGVWSYNISSLSNKTITAATVSASISYSKAAKAGQKIRFYLVPADKLSSNYAVADGTAKEHTNLTADNGFTTVSTELGLNDSNLIAEIAHGSSLTNAKFGSMLEAQREAGVTEAKIVALYSTVFPFESLFWSDADVTSPTLSVTSKELAIVDFNLTKSSHAAHVSRSGDLRFKADRIVLTSDNNEEGSHASYSYGVWEYDISEITEGVSKVNRAVINSTISFGAGPKADQHIKFYLIPNEKFSNVLAASNNGYNTHNSGSLNLTHTTGYGIVVNQLGLNDSNLIADVTLDATSKTLNVDIASMLQKEKDAGHTEIRVIALYSTYKESGYWSDVDVYNPTFSVSGTALPDINKINDENAVTDRVTVDNVIYTSGADTRDYGTTISTTAPYNTPITVNKGTIDTISVLKHSNADVYPITVGSKIYLAGDMQSEEFRVANNQNDVYATLKFIFTDDKVEYHRVAVKSVPVAAHEALSSYTDSGTWIETSYLTIFEGSYGADGDCYSNWMDLVKQSDFNGNDNTHTAPASDKTTNVDKLTGIGSQSHDSLIPGTTANVNNVTANYYIDTSNLALANGGCWKGDHYELPITATRVIYKTSLGQKNELNWDVLPAGNNSKMIFPAGKLYCGSSGRDTNGLLTEMSYSNDASVSYSTSASTKKTNGDMGDVSNYNFRIGYCRGNDSHWTCPTLKLNVTLMDKGTLRDRYNALKADTLMSNENNYTASSYANYLEALLTAEAYLSNFQLTGEETNILNALNTAANNLVRRADFNAFETAYNNADQAIKNLANGTDKTLHTATTIQALINAASDSGTRSLLATTAANKRELAATAVDPKTTALTDAVTAYNNEKVDITTDAFQAMYNEFVKYDKDIYDSDTTNAVKTIYDGCFTNYSYTDKDNVGYTVKTLNVADQNALDAKTAEMLTTANTHLAAYSVTIPGGVTSDVNLTDKVPYGTRVTLTADPDTVWYMQYNSNDTGRGQQYQTTGSSYSFVVYGNMTITTGQRAENTVKVTIKRKYSASNTNLPIVDVQYVAEGTPIPLDAYRKDIPCYDFTNFTDASGNVISGTTYTVGSKDATIYANYSYVQDANRIYNIVATDVNGNEIYNQTGVAYNTHITLKGGAGAYAWVEQVGTNTWRPFYIGADVTFFVQESTTLKAVTKDDYDTLCGGVTAASNLRLAGLLPGGSDSNGGKMIFNGQYVLPEGATALEWGILLDRFSESTDVNVLDKDLVLGNIDKSDVNGVPKYVRAKASGKTSANQYSIRISKLQSGRNFAYRSYLIYECTENGKTVTKTIYSDPKYDHI